MKDAVKLHCGKCKKFIEPDTYWGLKVRKSHPLLFQFLFQMCLLWCGSTELFHFITWGTWMSVQHFMAVNIMVVEVFHSKPHGYAGGKVIRIHCLSIMKICTKHEGNPPNSCWDISVWTIVVDQHTDRLIHPCVMLLAWLKNMSFQTQADWRKKI